MLQRDRLRLTLSFRRTTRQRAAAAALFVLAAAAGIASFAWGWCHITYPRTLTETATASVGHRSMAIYLSVWMGLTAILVGSLESKGVYLRRFIRSAALVAGVLAVYALYDLATERSRAIETLVTNTASAARAPVELMQEVINREVGAGIVRFSFAPGIYLAFLAAGLACAGVYVGRRALSAG